MNPIALIFPVLLLLLSLCLIIKGLVILTDVIHDVRERPDMHPLKKGVRYVAAGVLIIVLVALG